MLDSDRNVSAWIGNEEKEEKIHILKRGERKKILRLLGVDEDSLKNNRIEEEGTRKIPKTGTKITNRILDKQKGKITSTWGKKKTCFGICLTHRHTHAHAKCFPLSLRCFPLCVLFFFFRNILMGRLRIY